MSRSIRKCRINLDKFSSYSQKFSLLKKRVGLPKQLLVCVTAALLLCTPQVNALCANTTYAVSINNADTKTGDQTNNTINEPEMVMIDNTFSRAVGSANIDLSNYTSPAQGKVRNWVSSDPSIAFVDSNGILSAKKKGTARITLFQDSTEKEIFTVHITRPKLRAKNMLIGASNFTSFVRFNGVSEFSTIGFTSMNENNLLVDSVSGLLTPLKMKTTIVEAYADGLRFECSVCVGRKKAVLAVKNARKVIGSKYSQGKRMEDGFYDCSSLSWRSYQKAGLNMGKTQWALTASAQAQWCRKNGKLYSLRKIAISRLMAGDLIFYSSGKNGRYRNITHVAVYSGRNTIIHASSSAGAIVESEHVYFYKIKGIGRPARPGRVVPIGGSGNGSDDNGEGTNATANPTAGTSANSPSSPSPTTSPSPSPMTANDAKNYEPLRS